MKQIRKVGLMFFAIVMTGLASYAQSGNHSHGAPHGGTVQDADGYHIEMVKAKDTLSFYILGADGKAIKQTATGKVEYELSNKTKTTSTLVAGKGGSLQAGLPKANIVLYCTVTLTVGGKTISSKFKNTVSQAAQQHGHEH
ncbi:MAG: hypothetical protein J0H92_00520 [Sphingobacteriales bacterium]|nr:hypothetical protein [Sphingobacteriales bacterium]OJW35484.1 MAG: hypothetical protein BGO54_04025 [Sphingobacteriales bacterium 46-32]